MPEFNLSQKKAIHTVDGPVLCLAGPGSGKTTSMVHRILYMIEEKKISPSNILVITFTRASAKEMQERFYNLVEHDRKGCTFGTFHSVFFSILRTAYGYQGSNILMENEKYNIIRDLVRRMELECDDEDETVTSIIAEIGMMKSDMIPLEHFYSSCVGEEVFRDIYHQYQQLIMKNNKLDFDDMMVLCYELLKERGDILSALQRKYQYILVDEFQDINRIQYEITKMLAALHNNLFIVGDDDQSIYGFRGSRPEIMMKFKEDYLDATEILLDTNYRCSRNITEGALRVIQHNRIRFSKKIVSAKDYEEPIQIHHMKTMREEHQHLLNCLQQYKKMGIPYEEMAIIMRTNVQAGNIVRLLMSYNIPFQVRDSVPCIFDHFAVKNILDYIRAAMGIRERALFLRIINKPNRYIARDSLSESQFDFERMKRRYQNKDWAVDNLEQLEYDLQLLSSLKPYAAIHFIRNSIGYDSYLEEYCGYRHMNIEEIYGILDEVQEMAKQYKTFVQFLEGIEQYRIQFAEKIKKEKDKKRQGITITTMHSAKGLEYDVVFIIEANEGMTPYKKATKPDELEEERRMFYVAMTRARHHLHIYEVKDYYNKELQPSRFLQEINPVRTESQKEMQTD